MSPEPRRLHRAAISVYVLATLRDAALPLVIVLLLSVFRGGLEAGSLLNGAIFGAIGVTGAAVMGWWRWDNTRWWVDNSGIHKRSGMFTTKQTDIPWNRIQALDLQQGIAQRWFNVHAVHVQTGGGGAEGEIVLEAIWDEELDGLRELVAMRGGRVERVETEGRRLSGATLVVAALTAGQIGVILPVLAGAAQLAQNVLGDDAEREAVRLVPDTGDEWLLAAAVLLGAAWLLSFAGAVVAFAGFSVTRDEERLRIRRGLFEHREATIPVDRVRAVVVVEGLLRQPFGLAALRMEVIGHAKEPAAAQTLFPLLRRAEVGAFLEQVLPEFADDTERLEPLPGRALRRYVLPLAAAGLVVGTAAWPVTHFGALLALPAAGYGALRFRAAGWRLADGRLVVRSLALARTTVLGPAVLRESVTLGQTVLQRRGRLANLSVAFGKRTRARVHHLDADAARDVFTDLSGAFTSHSDVKAPGAPGSSPRSIPADE
jgi:putative membrane protein